MELEKFFRSVMESDHAPIVICDLEHTVVYMNSASIDLYHTDITGKSIKRCHNESSNARINQVIAWFAKSENNNSVHTFYNEKENKDVYMVALRDETGNLIGYYEKHEFRNKETAKSYTME